MFRTASKLTFSGVLFSLAATSACESPDTGVTRLRACEGAVATVVVTGSGTIVGLAGTTGAAATTTGIGSSSGTRSTLILRWWDISTMESSRSRLDTLWLSSEPVSEARDPEEKSV